MDYFKNKPEYRGTSYLLKRKALNIVVQILHYGIFSDSLFSWKNEKLPVIFFNLISKVSNKV